MTPGTELGATWGGPEMVSLISGAAAMFGFMATRYIVKKQLDAQRWPLPMRSDGDYHHGDWEFGPGPRYCDPPQVRQLQPGEDLCHSDYWTMVQLRANAQRDRETMISLTRRVLDLQAALKHANAHIETQETWADEAETAIAHSEGALAGLIFRLNEQEYDKEPAERRHEASCMHGDCWCKPGSDGT